MNIEWDALTSKGKTTQKKIFDAAIELINKYGYEQTTIIDICKLSGVSNGSFYHHFRSKDDILIRYVLCESGELQEYYRSLVDYTNREALEKVFHWQIDQYLVKGNSFISNLYSILILNKRDDGVEFRYSMTEVFTECFRKGQQCGEFRTDISYELMGKIAFESVFFITANWCINGGAYPLKEEAQIRLNELMSLFAS